MRRIVVPAIWLFAAAFGPHAQAQQAEFAAKVPLILSYLGDAAEGCVNLALADHPPFRACREGTEPVALTIMTGLPVRGEDGRVTRRCLAKLTAIPVATFPSVTMDMTSSECPQQTLKSGEFTVVFIGIIEALADWVQLKAKRI
jgi:hypothetical protein